MSRLQQRTRWVLALSLILLAHAAVAGTEVETFDLRYRSADAIVPLIQPLLSPEARITGRGGLLIVRGPDTDRDTVRDVLPELDRPAARLRVTLHHGRASDLTAHQNNATGTAVFGTPTPTVEGEVTLRRSHARGEDSDSITLQVLDGATAEAYIGVALPVVQPAVAIGPVPATVYNVIEYREFATRIRIIPRLATDRVEVTVEASQERPARQGGGTIEVAAVSTTLAGAPGEWLDLGGALQQAFAQSQGVVVSRREARDERHWWLRVDRAAAR